VASRAEQSLLSCYLSWEVIAVAGGGNFPETGMSPGGERKGKKMARWSHTAQPYAASDQYPLENAQGGLGGLEDEIGGGPKGGGQCAF